MIQKYIRKKQTIIFSIYLFCSKEYIHRVGRTARAGAHGHALLILTAQELGFLLYLKQARVTLSEFEFSWNKIADIQPQVCDFCSLFLFLNFDFSWKN